MIPLILKRRYCDFSGPFGAEHDARGDRRLAHRVADVEAFDALRGVLELEQIAQCLEARKQRLPAREPLRERGLGVAAREIEEARAIGAHVRPLISTPCPLRSVSASASGHAILGAWLTISSVGTGRSR